MWKFRAGSSLSVVKLTFIGVPGASSGVANVSTNGFSNHSVVKILLKRLTSAMNESVQPRGWRNSPVQFIVDNINAFLLFLCIPRAFENENSWHEQQQLWVFAGPANTDFIEKGIELCRFDEVIIVQKKKKHGR